MARREIGTLASSKNITRTQKVVTPSQKEKPQKYVRNKLDFNSLDHIGHGVRVSATELPRKYSNVQSEVSVNSHIFMKSKKICEVYNKMYCSH